MLTDAVMLQFAGAVARWFEFAGIAAIVVGSLLALAKAAQALLGRSTLAPDGRTRPKTARPVTAPPTSSASPA